MTRRYRLHGLERLRARALKDRQMALARAVGARAAVEREVARLQLEENRTLQALRAEISDPAAVRTWSDLADAHRQARGAAATRLRGAHQAETLARDAVAAARQQLRVLERLKERIAEEVRLDTVRAEERELNDRNAGRYARRMSLERV
ncbi:MAG: hypothetical protein HZB25_08770 [Candidatus Eisenbacteria bacterium]|nr:hypothetical protein [Candidatus Eisenbacteria bacterium]